MPAEPKQMEPMPPNSKFRRFGIAGFSLLASAGLFLIQQGCSVLPVEHSWVAGTAYSLALIVLLLLAVWFWDVTAGRHIFLRLMLSLVVMVVVSGASYRPIRRQWAIEHAPPAALPTPPAPPYRPYDLTREQRAKLVARAKPPLGAAMLRIGCVGWSERACVAAGSFLIAFSEAGWKIDGNRVFRLDPQIPGDGVFVINRPEPGPPLPPHLGRWHQMSLTDLTIWTAFSDLDIPVKGSTDTSLRNGVTGVYFGPEPSHSDINKQDSLLMHLSRFIAEGKDIEQRSRSRGINSKLRQRQEEWEQEVSDWLKSNLSESKAKEFQKSGSIADEVAYLLSNLQRSETTPQ